MIVEAIRCQDLQKLNSGMLPYVLSMPRTCPCGEAWLILLDEPLALEVEMGSEGQIHLTMLRDAMQSNCSNHAAIAHIRTDGEKVWNA
jgi:hypothetical protein